MKVKVIGVVKYGGKWHRPGDEISNVSEENAKQMVDQRIAEIINDDTPDKLQELRTRAIELGVANASKLGEKKLIDGIAEKEAEQQEVAEALEALRVKATELGIEGIADKDIETLIAEVEAAEKLKMEAANKPKDEPKE